MNHVYLGYIAGSLAFLQLIPYLISIFHGHTRPERATFAIWSLVNMVLVSSYIASGASTTIWVGLAYAFSSILIFGLSFRYGVGGYTKFDIICLLLALIGIAIWVSTSHPLVALYFSIAVKALGVIPTLRQVYYRPDTENQLSWAMCAAASIINLFALTSLEPNILSLPLYALLADGAVALMVLFPKLRPSGNYRHELTLYNAEIGE